MPKLGADLSEGKLIAWRKKPGDSVERGEIIADVETDKADKDLLRLDRVMELSYFFNQYSLRASRRNQAVARGVTKLLRFMGE